MTKGQIITELKKLRASLEKISRMEIYDDSIQVFIDNGLVRFRHRLPDGSRQYLNPEDTKTIKELSMKLYSTRMAVVATRELKQVDRCIKTLENNALMSDIDEVYNSLPEPIRKYIKPNADTDEGYVQNWLRNYSLSRNQRHQVDGPLTTLKGEIVKSKSEVIIADRLTYHNVPYVYEVNQSLDNEIFVTEIPDFTILKRSTREVFYWEHFGKMDDRAYATRNQRKLETYARNGIILGKNLLVSFETSDRPLRTEYVENIIKSVLL